MSLSNLNINLSSVIGYNIVGGGTIIGNAPQLQTVKTLDGVSSTIPTDYTALEAPLLDVAPLTDFTSIVELYSNEQVITMTNNGNYMLNVTDVYWTYDENVKINLVFPSDGSILFGRTINIAPTQTSTFKVSYIVDKPGVYSNQLYIISNNNGGIHKINTRQVVRETTGLRISPTFFKTTSTHLGQTSEVTYTAIPIKNEIERPDIIYPIYTTLQGNNAWTLNNKGNNQVSLKFNSNEVNNINGDYVSTLTMTVNGVSFTTINTATVNINYSLTKNLGTWLSTGSIHNSIIGMSYDLEAGDRYLTIGVGMGGDNSPLYDAGGQLLLDIASLGFTAESVSNPFPFWAEVCKIKFTGNEQTYLSKNYIVKTTPNLSYMYYFGNYNQLGSMFIITDDGYGSLTIKLNYLRNPEHPTSDTAVNVTLNNLTQAFYYPYSINALTTDMFIGFNYNTRDKVALVNTTVMLIPE